MSIKVKVRFNASRERLEKFGNGMYLIYLTYAEDNESAFIISALLSRELGMPSKKIEFAGIDNNKNWIFELV